MCVASFYDGIKSGLLIRGFYTAESLVFNDKTGIMAALWWQWACGETPWAEHQYAHDQLNS